MITFIESGATAKFFTNNKVDPIILYGNALNMGWGNILPDLPKNISLVITVGASRNIYVNLPKFAFKDKYINDPKYRDYKNRFRLRMKEELYRACKKY